MEQPKKGMRRGFMGTYLWYCGAAVYDAQCKTEEQALKGPQDARLGSDRLDANDILWCNNAMAAHDVPPNLVKVNATVLMVGVVEDKLFPPEEASQPIADAIPGARLFLYGSPLGHLGCAVHLGKANEAIVKFIAETEKN